MRIKHITALVLILSGPLNATGTSGSQNPAIIQRDSANREEFARQTAGKIQEDPEHACETTKSAVETADVRTIARIIEIVAEETPEKIQLVAQCAMAQAPDAAEAITAVLEKVFKNAKSSVCQTGSKSGTSAKDAKEGEAAAAGSGSNPLDFPTGPAGSNNTVGPPAGAAGGFSSLPPGGQTNIPIIINPPSVTEVNP